MRISFRKDQEGNSRSKNRHIPLLIVSLVLLTSLIIALLNFTVFSRAVNVHAASWTQVWGDDFNGASW